MNVEFHPEAAEELNEAATYYELELAGLGERLVSEVERIIDLLMENPEIGAPVEMDLRHFVLRRFPFSVIYAVGSDRLYVLALAHASRKPGYWRTRQNR